MVSLIELSALVFTVFSRVKVISKEVIVSEMFNDKECSIKNRRMEFIFLKAVISLATKYE